MVRLCPVAGKEGSVGKADNFHQSLEGLVDERNLSAASLYVWNLLAKAFILDALDNLRSSNGEM